MERFYVWREGFSINGETANASLVGSVEAETFHDACEMLFSGCSTYDIERNTDWGCRLYDNEASARTKFG